MLNLPFPVLASFSGDFFSLLKRMVSYSALRICSALWPIISERKDAAQILGMNLIDQSCDDLPIPVHGDYIGPLFYISQRSSLPEKEEREKCYRQMNLSFHNLTSKVYLDWWDESIHGFTSLWQKAKFLFYIDVTWFQHFYSRGERGQGPGEQN